MATNEEIRKQVFNKLQGNVKYRDLLDGYMDEARKDEAKIIGDIMKKEGILPMAKYIDKVVDDGD